MYDGAGGSSLGGSCGGDVCSEPASWIGDVMTVLANPSHYIRIEEQETTAVFQVLTSILYNCNVAVHLLD